MPASTIDEEDQAASPVTSDIGSHPLVPSAPSDAAPVAGAVTYPKPEPAPPKPPHLFGTPPAGVYSDNAEKTKTYEGALSRFSAQQMYEASQKQQKAINAETQQTLQSKHVQTATNPDTGAVEPVRDASGDIQYRTGKGPIRYDEQGRAVRTEYEESGPKQVLLDQNAEIGPHPERPNELYRQNKHADWDYLGTIAEGAQSKDPKIQLAARDAQLALDKRLHGEVLHDLSEEIAGRALAVQSKVQDFHGKAATLKNLNQQLENFDKDHPGVNDTEGHWFTGGVQPTQSAQALQADKAGIAKQIEDLQSEGYSSVTDPKVVKEFAKPEIEALQEAKSHTAGWLAPKEPGDLERLIQDRTASLAEEGKSSTDDPVLVALQKRKEALGLNQPSQKQDEAMKADPLYAPIVAERDKLKADRTAADQALTQVQTEYEQKLAPLRSQLSASEAQIAPIRENADKLQARLESLIGMPAMTEGEDPDARRQEISNRVAQITDQKTKVRVQTILNTLEPLSSELRQRDAERKPIVDAHDSLQEEAQNAIASRQQELTAAFADREQQLNQRLEVAQAVDSVRQSREALSLINATLIEPTSPAFAAEIANAKEQDRQDRMAKNPSGFEPSNLERGVISGAAGMAGGGILGLTKFLEAVSDRITVEVPGIPNNYKDEGARALGNMIMKVPGVMNQGADKNAFSYKAGNFAGGVGLAIGEGIVSPYLLAAQFFGSGYNGQAEAAQAYFDQKALENPNTPRDLAAEKASVEKAGVLGGAVNAVLAIPFRVFGKTVTEVFGSARANSIANVLKASYERGGIQAVAEDLRILQRAITKTAGEEAFKDAAAKSLEPVIQEIVKPALQRVGAVGIEAAKNAAIFGGVEAAQNLVSRTYNPKTGLFENVPTAAGQGAILGAFFGGILERSRAQRASEARTELGTALAKQAQGPGPGEAPGQLPPGGGGGPQTPTGPTPEAAHAEIDSLAPSEQVKPEQVLLTQHALRGLVKISQGQPLESLTSVERTALEAKTPEGVTRIEKVNGQPVITDSTLARVRQIAPVTAQLLPQNEETQRQSILAKGKKGSETAPEIPAGQQPTFTVEVQNAGGETRNIEVRAADEKAARTQVAGTIKPGEGLIRDVTQTSEVVPAEHTAYVPPERFEEHVVSQIQTDASQRGHTLKPEEEAAVRALVKVAAPAYERWSKAFDTVNATLEQRESAGVTFSPGTRALNLSIPDLARHAALYSAPESGEALIRHEAAHAVTTASGAKVVELYKSAPAALQNAMKEAYQSQGAADYNYAHELWAYVLAGKVEMAAGRKIKLSGKFLPEQAKREFIVKYKRAFAEVLRFTRDIEGYLRKRGVAEDIIAQWKELDDLFVSKIRAVDASDSKPTVAVESKLPAEQARGPVAVRGPPQAPVVEQEGVPVPVESGGQVEAPQQPTGEVVPRAETPVGAVEPATGAELSPEEKTHLASGLILPEGAIGHAAKAVSNDKDVNIAYIAQDASASRTSHDAEGNPTKGYDQELQPRDRSLVVYRKQAQNLSRSVDFAKFAFFPETTVPATTADLGAPIMVRNGDTLTGNGREIAIKLAYDRGLKTAEKYRDDFIRNARTFGIDPAVVRDMKHPILKRVILDPLSKDELVQFSQESNQPAAMASNAIEVAGQDATKLTPELLSLFDPNYALDAGKNKQFLETYLRDVVRGSTGNEANLTGAELERRVRSAVFAYAYGMDKAGRVALDRLAGDEGDTGKKITNALLTVAPIVARMKTDIARGDLFPLDISPAIARGTQDISEALRNKPAKQSAAAALDNLRDQASLETDPLERSVLEFLLDNRTRKQAIEIGLSNYVEAVFGLGNPRNGDLFGREQPTALDLFKRATSDLKSQAIADHEIAEIGLSSKDLTDVPQEERAQYLVARGERAGNSHQKLSQTSDEALDALISDSGRTAGAQHAVFISGDGQILTRAEMAKEGLPTHSQELGKENANAVHQQKTNEVLQREQGQTGVAGGERGRVEPGQQGSEPTAVRSEVGGGEPAQAQAEVKSQPLQPEENLPTLREGEKQGDLLSKQEEDFRLVGQEGIDHAAIQAAREKAIADRAESAKGQLELFSQAIEKLPARMTGALRGLLSGDSIEEIGRENGVAKEGVGRLAKEAIRRLREVKSETSEQLDVLENTVNQELKAQETNDPLKQLMASINTDILSGLYEKAEKEKPGQFETGRPDLSLGAEGASIRATHQFHTDTFKPETIKEWDATADRHLSDPEWSRKFSNEIIGRYLNGDGLLAWEVRAAMRLVAADSHAIGTPAEKLVHAIRAFSYARIRSKQGQELASGRDPFKTPEERGREFLSKTFFRLSPKKEAEIETEQDPGQRQEKLSKAMTERIAQLEKAFSYLSGRGITLDDIFNGAFELHGKGKQFLESQMADYEEKQKKALKLAQTGTRSAQQIAKETGLSVKDVERINDEFIDKLEKELTAKVAAGLTLETMDVKDALLAQPTEPNLPANAKTPEQIKAEVRRIIRGMGFVASKDLGTFKVKKQKRPKLFVPPPPSRHIGPSPTEEAVPFEERRQNQLIFTPEQAMRNVNPRPGEEIVPAPGQVLGQKGLPLNREMELPKPGGPIDERTSRLFNPEQPRLPNENAPVPYPEGQAAPYTGRVLGQTGLPLYQEMMIRKGTDMGSMDDLIRIGRVAQSLDSKPFDMVYEAWINNIFSAAATHTANISGNTLSTVMDYTLQRGMESLLNTIYRDADSPTFGEFKYIMKGILPGIVSGIKRGARAWNIESSVFSNDVLNDQTEILEALDKSGGVPPAIRGKLGRVIRIPVRALLFEDEVFKSLIGQMEVGAQAYRIAKQEGLSGDAMVTRMNELTSVPGSKAWARAVEKAIYLTYQEPTGLTTLFRNQGKAEALGKMAAKAQSEGRERTASVLRGEEMVVRNLYRAASIFFPVVRTTYNIFKIGVAAANPLPSVTTIPYRAARAGYYQWKDGKPFVDSYSKARQIRDLARQILAWSTYALLWNAVAGDEDDDKKSILLTGSQPFTQVKKGIRELNERAHGGTYMLRIGGRDGLYVPYGRVEPIATVLGTVADTIANIKKAKNGLSLADTGDALLGYFLAQAQAKTMLQGFGDMTKAIEGSTGWLDIPKKLFLQSLVPNMIRQPIRSLDEWVRDYKSASPLYQTLPLPSLAQPKINVYGQPVAKGGNAFSRMFISAGVKPDAQLQKADQFLLNWNREHPAEAWAPTTPPATYHDAAGKTKQMTPAEETKFLQVSGRRAADMLRGQLTESQVKRPSEEDLKRIKKIFEDAHEQTKKELFPKTRVNQVRAWMEESRAA